jgi:hypothetical protein
VRSITRIGRRTVAGAFAAVLVIGAVTVATGATRATAPNPTYLTFIAYPHAANPSVAIATVGGNDVRILGHGSTALISPDGSSVAVISTSSTSEGSTSTLWIYPSRGGPARKLYHSSHFIYVFGWSVDSRLLLADLSGDANGIGPLLSINAANGATHTIAKGVIGGASFSQESSDDVVYSLAQSQLSSAAVNIYTSTATGGHVNEIVTGGHSTDPLWGPKGIVFVRQSSRGTNAEPLNQLWFIESNGAGARQLTHMSASPLVDGLVPVAFSANGSHLLADFQGTDTSSAWTVDLSGAKPVVRDLDGIADGNIAAGISRNGQTILIDSGFEGSPQSVETIPWAGGKPTVLAKQGAFASWNY